jgi:hypothetical protein
MDAWCPGDSFKNKIWNLLAIHLIVTKIEYVVHTMEFVLAKKTNTKGQITNAYLTHQKIQTVFVATTVCVTKM